MKTLYIIIGVLGIVILWIIVTYNGLVSLKNLVKEGWSGIDVQLKRRHDLIPNLVEAVKGYKGYEEKVLVETTKLRAEAAATTDVKQRSELESALSTRIAGILAIAENYPQLKASDTFINLQKNLSDIEEQIQLARRYYNGTAREFNTKIQSFPNMLIAGPFGFTTVNYFELSTNNERAVPEVKF
jgi:LemA protein